MITLGPSDSLFGSASAPDAVNFTAQGLTTDASTPPIPQAYGNLVSRVVPDTFTSLVAPGEGASVLISHVEVTNASEATAEFQLLWGELNGYAVTLAAGESAVYDDGAGWIHYDANGTPLSAPGAAPPAAFPIWQYGDGSDGPLLFTASPRTITDAVLIAGSAIITSDTADWTDDDVGLVLNDLTSGDGAIPLGTRIKSVTNGTTAVMTTISASDFTGDTVLIGAGDIVPGNYSSLTLPTGATARPVGISAEVYGMTCVSGEYFIDGTIDLSGDYEPRLNPGTGSGPGFSQWPPVSGSGGAGSIAAPADNPGYLTIPGFGNFLERQPFLAFNLNSIHTGSGEEFGALGGTDADNNVPGDAGNAGFGWAIAARHVVHGPNATYNIKGQDAIDSTDGNTGGSGGGADGWWLTFSDTLVGAPAVIGGGGAGSSGAGTGTAGTDGEPGFGIHYTPGNIDIQTPS